MRKIFTSTSFRAGLFGLALWLGHSTLAASVSEVLAIDQRVAGWETLAAAARPGVEVVLFDGNRDAVGQLAAEMRKRLPVSALHLVTHGAAGELHFGNQIVDRGALRAGAGEWRDLARALVPHGSLLLYGCNVAQGSTGSAFVDELATVTGLNIAASSDFTGNPAQGGNWVLEARRGQASFSPAMAEEKLVQYQGVLGATLGKADLVVVGFNGGTAFPPGDAYVLAAMTAIPANSIVFISDLGYLANGTRMASATGDLTVTWNSGASVIPAGTFIRFTGGSSGTNANTTVNVGSVTGGVTLLLNSLGGDQLIIYQTANDTGTGTIERKAAGGGTEAIPIYALNYDIHAAGTDLNGWSTTATASQITSALPTGMTATSSNDGSLNGTTADAFGRLPYLNPTPNTDTWDDYKYNGSTTPTTKAGWLARLHDINNWTGNQYADTSTALDLTAGSLSGSGFSFNSPPAFNSSSPQTLTVSEDASATSINSLLAVTDTDSGQTLTWSVTTSPTKGSLGGFPTTATSDGGSKTPSGLTYTPTANQNGSDTFVIQISDGTATASMTVNVTITGKPDVTNVTATTADGTYNVPDQIDITVTFDQAVTVVNSPQIQLNSGASVFADYLSGSGGTTLTFRYTVGAGQTSSDLDYVSTSALTLNGGTINGTSGGLAATLTLASPGTTGWLGASKSIVIDTTAPAAPVFTGITTDTGSSSTDQITSDQTLILSGTAEASSTLTFTRVGTGVIGTATATGGGTWSFNYTGTTLPAGSYSFTATAADAVGNVSSASSAFAVTVDTSAPAAPAFTGITTDTGSSSSDQITSDQTLILSGTAEANSTVTVTRVGTGVIGTATATGGGTWSFNYTGTTLPAGSYSFTATATDAAGNVSAASSAFAVTVDTSAPAAPAFTGITTDTGSSSSDQITSDQTLILSGTAEANSTVTVTRVGTGVIGTATTTGGGTWSFDYTGTTLPAGSYSFTATATDAAGNVSSASSSFAVTVDTGAPAAPAFTGITTDTGSSSSDQITSDQTLILSGTAEANSTVTVTRVGTGVIGTATTTGGGTWSFDYTGTTLPAGSYSFTATATDAAGNVSSASSSFAVTVDTSAPAAPAFTGITTDTGSSSSDQITSDQTLILSGTAEANSTVTVTRVGTGVIGTATTTGGGTWSFDYTGTTLPAGSYSFTATATDAAGNVSSASSSFAVTVDTGAPAVDSIVRQSPAGPTTGASSVTFRVTFSEAVTGVDAADFTVSGTASGTVGTPSFVSTGVYDVTVSSITGAGSLRLDTISSASIEDTAGNSISATAFTSGETYTINAVTDHFTVTLSSGSATAGAALNVTVTAKDSGGATVTTYTGTVHFTSSDGTATLPSDYTFIAGDNGVHTFTSGVTLKTAGSQTVTATDTVTASITGVSTSATVSPAAADHLVVTLPGSATAGTAVSATVTARDVYGNTATGYTGTVHFTSTDSAATLPADYAFIAGDNGTHTFTSGATLKTAGSQTVTATDTTTSSIAGTSGSVVVGAAAASVLAVTLPGSATAGVFFIGTVTARDAYGNTAASYTGNVTFTGSDPAAVYQNNLPLTNGVGNFPFTLKTAGTQTVTATDTVTSSITGTSGNVTVNPGAVTKLLVSLPATANATAVNATVTAQDAYGNTNPGYTGTVTFTSTDGAATLPANYSFVSGDSGTHIFAGGVRFGADGTWTVTATDTVTASITGTSANVVADVTPPSISISAPLASITTTANVTFTVTYSGADTITLADGDVTVNSTGGAGATASVSGSSPTTRTVTLSGFTGRGTLGISIAGGTASDTAGNNALSAGPSTTFILNAAPVANNDALTKPAGVFKIAITTLLANDTDADGDARTLTTFDAVTAGSGTVTRAGPWLVFTPQSGNSLDTFNYSISDGRGGTATASVTVTLAGADTTQSKNVLGITTDGADKVLNLAGIPGVTYTIQYTASLAGTPTWTDLDTVVAGANGLFTYRDVAPGGSSRFYRAIVP